MSRTPWGHGAGFSIKWAPGLKCISQAFKYPHKATEYTEYSLEQTKIPSVFSVPP